MFKDLENIVFIHLKDGSHIKHNYKEIIFPSGEFQHRLDVDTIPPIDDISWIEVITNGLDVFGAAQLRGCFRAHFGSIEPDYVLTVAYLGSARQDRVCNKGECATANIVLDWIEQLGYDFVYVLDIHNIKSLENRHIVNLDKKYVFKFAEKINGKSFYDEYDTFLAPDKGAEEQVKQLAMYFKKGFVSCSKERDPLTGKLSGFTLNGSVKNKKVLIVDDLLDAGGTFLGINELLGEADKVSLYVTHGLFTKGVGIVTDVFDKVYCTNSYYVPSEDDPQNLKVFDVLTPRNKGENDE